MLRQLLKFLFTIICYGSLRILSPANYDGAHIIIAVKSHKIMIKHVHPFIILEQLRTITKSYPAEKLLETLAVNYFLIQLFIMVKLLYVHVAVGTIKESRFIFLSVHACTKFCKQCRHHKSNSTPDYAWNNMHGIWSKLSLDLLLPTTGHVNLLYNNKGKNTGNTFKNDRLSGVSFVNFQSLIVIFINPRRSVSTPVRQDQCCKLCLFAYTYICTNIENNTYEKWDDVLK